MTVQDKTTIVVELTEECRASMICANIASTENDPAAFGPVVKDAPGIGVGGSGPAFCRAICAGSMVVVAESVQQTNECKWTFVVRTKESIELGGGAKREW